MWLPKYTDWNQIEKARISSTPHPSTTLIKMDMDMRWCSTKQMSVIRRIKTKIIVTLSQIVHVSNTVNPDDTELSMYKWYN